MACTAFRPTITRPPKESSHQHDNTETRARQIPRSARFRLLVDHRARSADRAWTSFLPAPFPGRTRLRLQRAGRYDRATPTSVVLRCRHYSARALPLLLRPNSRSMSRHRHRPWLALRRTHALLVLPIFVLAAVVPISLPTDNRKRPLGHRRNTRRIGAGERPGLALRRDGLRPTSLGSERLGTGKPGPQPSRL